VSIASFSRNLSSSSRCLRRQPCEDDDLIVILEALSNTMDASFRVAALEEALARYGKPEIFNADQGGQFTSADFTGVLIEADVRISMDGRGRWMDNVFIGRVWRSLKYEVVYQRLRLRSRGESRHQRLDHFLQRATPSLRAWETQAFEAISAPCRWMECRNYRALLAF
jgi:transposase InsO family protein